MSTPPSAMPSRPSGPHTAVDTIPVSLRHVRFSYDGGTSWALDDVSLDIADGERVCVVGSNGSGKST